jgi:2-methylisocitrate lyase-like PEP mutase family enzyme
MVDQLEKARCFATMHQNSGAFVIANPWDVGSALLLQGLGFEALATTSSGHAFTLGQKDGSLSREEILEHARAICNATRVPVTGDLENGFGDSPATVAQTIVAAAEAGLVGASIDDATGHSEAPIHSLDFAIERIHAAAEVSRELPFEFILTARAENHLHGCTDLDDTIRRLAAYAEAGADVLFAPGLDDIESIRSVCTALSKPVNVIAGSGPRANSVDRLAAAGARRISLGSMLLRAALGGVVNAAREILDEGTFDLTKKLALKKAELEEIMTSRSNSAGC